MGQGASPRRSLPHAMAPHAPWVGQEAPFWTMLQNVVQKHYHQKNELKTWLNVTQLNCLHAATYRTWFCLLVSPRKINVWSVALLAPLYPINHTIARRNWLKLFQLSRKSEHTLWSYLLVSLIPWKPDLVQIKMNKWKIKMNFNRTILGNFLQHHFNST